MEVIVRTPEDVQKLGTILGVWAHPDDESFLAAGLLAAAVAKNQRVVLVTATRGEAGVRDETRWPRARLADIRTAELAEALQILCITDHRWLDYGDGLCNSVAADQAVARIEKIIDEVQPDTILTFGPEGLTGHPDHICASNWATQAAKGRPINLYYAVEDESRYQKYLKDLDEEFDIYFNIDKPPLREAKQCEIALTLPDTLVAKKRAALLAMPSQYEGMLDTQSAEVLQAILSLECFVRAT